VTPLADRSDAGVPVAVWAGSIPGTICQPQASHRLVNEILTRHPALPKPGCERRNLAPNLLFFAPSSAISPPSPPG